MSVLEPDRLRAITTGRWLAPTPSDLRPAGVGTDTRADLAGRVFIALRGEHFDGNDHLDAAAEAGAVLAIVDRDDVAPPRGLPALLVDDARAALGRLARAHRRELTSTRVIGITGSAGKTTTKRLVHAVLAPSWPGSSAPKSFNNDVGVPLTILAARPTDRFLICEIGTNAPGEIGRLAAIVEPDLAVITNIGRSHLAGFGDVEAVLREKASLLAHLRPGGCAVLNAAHPELVRCLTSRHTVVRYGDGDDSDMRVTDRGRAGDGAGAGRWWVEVNRRWRFELALPGPHNAVNALAAVAVGRRFGLDDAAIAAALADVEPGSMRMDARIVPRGDGVARLVVDDSYNANPESMAAALATFPELAGPHPRRAIVLGDMLELGGRAESLHAALAPLVADLDAACPLVEIVLVGEHVAATAAALAPLGLAAAVTRHVRLDATTLDALARRLGALDAVLLKGSRGIGLDRLAAALRDHGSSTGAAGSADPAPQELAPRP